MLRSNHISGPNFKMEIPEEKVKPGMADPRKNQNINELISEISEFSFLCHSQKDKQSS